VSSIHRTENQPLEYAPTTTHELRVAKWRKWARRILWSALVTVLIATAWRTVRHSLYLRRQHQLMTYSGPLGPLEADARKNLGRVKWPIAAGAVGVDTVGSPVFIHERRTRDGIARLVIVQSIEMGPGVHHLVATPYEPSGFMPGSTIRERSSRGFAFPALRILNAQPDANDPSHFMITYELDGQRGMIDGWLEDEHSVILEPRDGPLKSPGLPPPADKADTRIPSSMPG
jgi:hypothetical protein